MSSEDRKDAVNPDYPLERLRKDRTELSKENFPKAFNVKYGKYREWVKKDQYPKLCYDETILLAEVVKMSPNELQEYIKSHSYTKY